MGKKIVSWSLKDSLCIFDIHHTVSWRKPARLSERVKLDFTLPEELKSGLLEFFPKGQWICVLEYVWKVVEISDSEQN